MKSLADDFLALQPDQRQAVHFLLCSHVLDRWQQYIRAQEQLSYVESVVGTYQEVDQDLPADAFESAQLGADLKAVRQRYREPIAALQDDDLEFPPHIEFAYYAIYNLFRKYAQLEEVDDWLIVNQALSAESDGAKQTALLAAALTQIEIEAPQAISSVSTVWQLWYTDKFDGEAPPSLETTGTNILHGLYELWLRTLREGILDSGNASFSGFHLAWGDTALIRIDIDVRPFGNFALEKLRRWAHFSSGDEITQNEMDNGLNNPLVWKLARLHFSLLLQSGRWTAAASDWSAEAKELLARVDALTDPSQL
jgi:hypothetical protein